MELNPNMTIGPPRGAESVPPTPDEIPPKLGSLKNAPNYSYVYFNTSQALANNSEDASNRSCKNPTVEQGINRLSDQQNNQETTRFNVH